MHKGFVVAGKINWNVVITESYKMSSFPKQVLPLVLIGKVSHKR